MSSPKLPQSKRERRQNYHHGDLEPALLAAAIDLVRKNGPDHLSLRAVAQQVGVSPSAVYHYFPDKDELIHSLSDRLFEDLYQMQQEALSRIPGKSKRAATSRFRELGRTYFLWAKKEPNLFRLMFGGYCKVRERGSHVDHQAFMMLSKCLDDLLETGVISVQMRKYGELVTWSCVQGASTLIVEGHLPEESFEALLEGLELSMKAVGK